MRQPIDLPSLGWALLVLMGGLLSGCTGVPAETDGDGGGAVREAHERMNLGLAPSASSVRTVQLYREPEEGAQPILPLGGGQQLTLAFDLVEARGRPLSVYFYHADRSWRRDLSPIEYLDGFQSDNLLDYTSSRGTDVPYVHYRYRFPNDEVGFRVSGNYVVRVTEQGREDEVLVERAFFVTEQVGALVVGLENVMVSGQGLPSELPEARYTPPSSLSGNPFDYATCFVRNGAYAESRCTDDPRLIRQPTMAFDLNRSRAFAPTAAPYVLDLSSLQVGGDVEANDRSVTPPRVVLEPDYAAFPGAGTDSLLAGQVLVDAVVRDVAEPATEAQYATVRFSFVPPEEEPLYGDLWLLGTFGPAATVPADTLRWVPARSRYEGEVLVKQGRYEYHYDAPDPALRGLVQRALPRLDSRYHAFVYYRDVTLGTDRLLAVGGTRAP